MLRLFIICIFNIYTFAQLPTGINQCISLKKNKSEYCLKMQKSFDEVVLMYSKDDQTVLNLIDKELKLIKDKRTYNYFPIFLATTFHSQRSLAELKRLENLEEKLKLKFKFAKYAIRRLTNKECSKKRVYKEICYFKDSRIERLRNYYQ